LRYQSIKINLVKIDSMDQRFWRHSTEGSCARAVSADDSTKIGDHGYRASRLGNSLYAGVRSPKR